MFHYRLRGRRGKGIEKEEIIRKREARKEGGNHPLPSSSSIIKCVYNRRCIEPPYKVVSVTKPDQTRRSWWTRVERKLSRMPERSVPTAKKPINH